MGHFGARNLFQLANVSTGMDLKRKRKDNNNDNEDICYIYYATGRLYALLYKGYLKPADSLLELIYTNLLGKINL